MFELTKKMLVAKSKMSEEWRRKWWWWWRKCTRHKSLGKICDFRGVKNVQFFLLILIFSGCILSLASGGTHQQQHPNPGHYRQHSTQQLKRSRSNQQSSRSQQIHHQNQELHDERTSAKLISRSIFGLSPSVFNVAGYARITTNATCGTVNGREEFCRLARGKRPGSGGGPACGVCDANSPDFHKRHLIEFAIDGTGKWWQSPTLENGPEFETVTITLDLQQVFLVSYVIIKAANSPRPGTWILERSLDNEYFEPWQYYVTHDQECWDRFGIPPTPGKPKYKQATDVICTSYYSKLFPIENGAIHTSLMNERPISSNESWSDILEFTKARYIRLRLLQFAAAHIIETASSSSSSPKWFTSGTYSEGPQIRLFGRPGSGGGSTGGISEAQLAKRLFYSIKDISIGAQCDCNGHASSCVRNPSTELFECECEHNTCGIHCEMCCPLYNQIPWESGRKDPNKMAISGVQDPEIEPLDDFVELETIETFEDGIAMTAISKPFKCELCECHGHATQCRYDPLAAIDKLSLDVTGRYRGGGICVNCTSHTTGVNCELCEHGFYRPSDRTPSHPEPCVQCDCHPSGSSDDGDCLREAIFEDQTVGDCICKPGFTGPRCSECATGFRGFPNCVLCPCDARGTEPTSRVDCEGDCDCKMNVDGPTCSRCKPGYFALQAQNPEGCVPCYCSGVSSTCESNIPVPQLFETLEGWLVSDITVTYTAKPTIDTDTQWLLIGNNEFYDLHEAAKIEAYYWLAPPLYLGNKLEAYGSVIEFSLNWVVMRGDTSGKPTTGPNLILIGHNGLRIAYGDSTFTGKNTTFKIPLSEHNWYHVPKTVKDIITRLRRTGTDYKGEAVTRSQFLSVLANIKHVLLRAKFHTDQIEGALETCRLEIQNEDSNAEISIVEKCACPTGYTGLSCEECEYGYVKIEMNISTYIQHIQCVKCDCNGHSRRCNLTTGACECDHNTIGEKCERCAAGFYGNPLNGQPDDCKRCACPLLNPENNFSPSCQLDLLESEEDEDIQDDDNFEDDDEESDEDYVCTQCPQGYTGDHCEICDDGYYGDPTKIGSSCQPCECGGGPCDRISGQCLSCRGNTEGWRCERCKLEHFGDPQTANCQPCQCDPVGSETQICDLKTGQCKCKERYTGRMCHECEPGYGNRTAGCKKCACNEIGAVSPVCDPISGLCECHNGVEGFYCDACQHLHFGFSAEGCQSCGCNLHGSELPTCDIVSGQCRCKQHVIGRKCDTCEPGFWGLSSNQGCSVCDCDPLGSLNGSCDPVTGHCYCKHGVRGSKCDSCIDKFYGFSDRGCRECEHCDKPGHICDPDTGRCVCPSFSHGENCNRCMPNSWGFEPHRGCKACHCDSIGSLRSQCDPFTGRCPCREGYTGNKCNQCDFGFYGFPRCRRCNCDLQGTDEFTCNRSLDMCPCNEEGQCTCKSNVLGKKCDQCKDGTFGLEKNNPEGCTQCFCFGRTSHCTQAGLTWGQIRLKGGRMLQIEKVLPPHRPVSNIAYIKKIVPKRPYYTPINEVPVDVTTIHSSHLNESLTLSVIPESDGNITIGAFEAFRSPLYWRLPDIFYGDRVVSYGGYLQYQTFTIEDDADRPFPLAILDQYPLVVIKGNGITIAHFPLVIGKPEVRFHESLWTIFRGVGVKLDRKHKQVSRELLMVVLQNVEEILIRASDIENLSNAVLFDAVMDTAILVPGPSTPSLAKGVELCECPKQYNSSSCQDPSVGFYRWYNPSRADGTIIIDLIGDVRPCECNGRSSVCNIETGYCMNCSDNTSGANCEVCAEGFYGSPDSREGCLPCPCPSSEQHKFASRGCYKINERDFVCECKPGYKGKSCERCSLGYFRNPLTQRCDSCKCNVDGRASEECDEETGECNCKVGVIGKDCSRCAEKRYVLENKKCVPCDICSQSLLDKIEQISDELQRNTHHIEGGVIPPPYPLLQEFERNVTEYYDELEEKRDVAAEIETIPLTEFNEFISRAKEVENQLKHLKRESHKAEDRASNIKKRAEKFSKRLSSIKRNIYETVSDLAIFGIREKHVNVQKSIHDGSILLNEIRGVNFRKEYNRATDVLSLCEFIFTRLSAIDQALNDFYSRINDIIRLVNETIDKIRRTEQDNQINRDHINDLKIRIDLIDKERVNLDKKTSEIDEKLENSLLAVSDSEERYRMIENQRIRLNDLYNRLQKREGLDMSIVQEVNNARNYANHLKKLSEGYARIFKATQDSAHKSLEASQVYKNIVLKIEEARYAAENATAAADAVSLRIYPDYEDSLIDRASLTFANSNRIKSRLEIQHNNLKKLRNQQMHLNLTIERVMDTLWNTGLQDNDIAKKLVEFNSTITESMKNILQRATQESVTMKGVYHKAKQIQDDKAYKLMPAFNDLNTSEANISVTLSRAAENLTEVQTRMNTLGEQLNTFDITALKQREMLNRWNDSLAEKLQSLKNKVAEARRLTSEIQIPLTSKSSEKCTRSFRPYLISMINTTSTSISFVLSITNDAKNSPLFYLSGAKHFIAIEMANRTIRLVWNLGDDTGVVVHPEVIEKLTERSGYYYNVEVERIRNIGKLLVRKKFLANGTTVPPGDSKPPVIKSTNPHFTILNVGSMSEVWIGGIPPSGVKNSLLLKKQGLDASIYDVVLNEKPIGLWNYVKNSKGACQSDNYWTYTLSEYQFNGVGYSVREVKNPFASTRMSITLTFKTFDENALLLAVVGAKNDSFLTIYLDKGQIVYYVQYVGESRLEIRTEDKYNTGKKIQIEGSREFNRKKVENAVLKVDGKTYLGKPDIPLTKKNLPDFKTAKYFIGGFPPNYIDQMQQSIVFSMPELTSILGCMSDIDIERVRYDPVEMEHDGVDYSCSEKTLNRVGFFGKGFIKLSLASISVQKLQSLSFVFVTRRENALLTFMLLKTDNSPKEKVSTASYILVRLKEGKVQVEIKPGSKNKFLMSQRTYNDGVSHALSLTREHKNVTLRIDDALEDSINLGIHGHGEVIYFGGFPDLENGEMIVTDDSFEGTIRDVIINNELVLFNNPLAFEHVKIGRNGPIVSAAPMEIGVRSIPMGMGVVDDRECSKNYQNNSSYLTEPGAIKFGDAPFSHAQYPLNIADFWHKTFTLEFEFRTFYPNGMLFVSPGLREKQRHHILLQIKNRMIHLSIKGRKARDLHMLNKVNNGNWHKVAIKSSDQKWTLIVDDTASNSIKIPKKLNVANMIYVGAWPEYGHRLTSHFVRDLEPFKGCVRNLKINGVARTLNSDFLHNTRECFPRIESGSYFSGDAYAIYRNNFQIPNNFEVSLEFRTSELNGILITTGGTNNPPGFSLELIDGKVVLSAQINYNKPIRVEAALSTPYDICDNQWHNVTAFYSENQQISLKLDEVLSNSYITDVDINNQIEMNFESALYIGGISDSTTSPTLQTRTSFHGCIKNIAFENEKRDWTDMDELHNVLLSSCPVV